MNKKNIFILMSLFSTMLLLVLTSATMQQVNFTTSSSGSSDSPQLFVTSLKYEPYPANAGDWFDVWVKVENIGLNDAKNVKFELLSDYPFTADDSSYIREFGTIPGITNAYAYKQNGDTGIEANQAVMKFRVKIASNAPIGDSDLKVKGSVGSDSTVFSLPISIAKTRTDFEVIMQDTTSTGTSFALANIGDNPASAVIASIIPQAGLMVSGSRSSIIGNLGNGDFTTVSFQISPNNNVRNMTMNISYTDTAGIRNSVEKVIEFNNVGRNSTGFNSSRQFNGQRGAAATSSTPSWQYVLIGIILGVAGIFLYNRMKKKD